MKQVGKSGDWRSLGLPSLRDIEYDPPRTKTKIADAYRRLRVGETVLNPFGEMLFVDDSVTNLEVAQKFGIRTALMIQGSDLEELINANIL